MEYRRLGKTGVKVSVVGLGCGPIGGTGWGEVSEEQSISVIHGAMDLGINLFDVAPIYGFGRAEKILGKALKGKRKKVLVTSKCGLEWNERKEIFPNGKPEYIRRDCERGMGNLRTDYIDILQIHTPDLNIPLSETIGEMLELQKEGKIRFLGFSNFLPEQMKECLKYAEFVSLQYRYNFLEREMEKDILPFCKREKISVFSHTSMAMGLLSGSIDLETKFPSGDARNDDSLFQGENFRRNLGIVKKVKGIAGKYKCTPAQLAVSWILQRREITSVLVGTRSASRIEENARGAMKLLPVAHKALSDLY